MYGYGYCTIAAAVVYPPPQPSCRRASQRRRQQPRSHRPAAAGGASTGPVAGLMASGTAQPKQAKVRFRSAVHKAVVVGHARDHAGPSSRRVYGGNVVGAKEV